MISWSKTCIPKCYGGIGLPSTSALIYGYNGTLIWRILTLDCLLAFWWKNKYFFIWKPPTSNASPFWKNLFKMTSHFKQNITYTIGNGKNINMIWNP